MGLLNAWGIANRDHERHIDYAGNFSAGATQKPNGPAPRIPGKEEGIKNVGG